MLNTQIKELKPLKINYAKLKSKWLPVRWVRHPVARALDADDRETDEIERETAGEEAEGDRAGERDGCSVG